MPNMTNDTLVRKVWKRFYFACTTKQQAIIVPLQNKCLVAMRKALHGQGKADLEHKEIICADALDEIFAENIGSPNSLAFNKKLNKLWPKDNSKYDLDMPAQLLDKPQIKAKTPKIEKPPISQDNTFTYISHDQHDGAPYHIYEFIIRETCEPNGIAFIDLIEDETEWHNNDESLADFEFFDGSIDEKRLVLYTKRVGKTQMDALIISIDKHGIYSESYHGLIKSKQSQNVFADTVNAEMTRLLLRK